MLTLLGIMLFIVLAINAPDCIACHPIHLAKTAGDSRIDKLEAQDLTNRLRGAALSVDINYNTLIVKVEEPLLNSDGFREINREIDNRNAIEGAWMESYSSHHGNVSLQDECVRIVWEDPNGRVLSSCRTRDSVERLIENDGLCFQSRTKLAD